MNQKELLSVGSPEDVLAYVPHVLGYWPQLSLVVLAMRGKQLGASLRLDLPDRAAGPASQSKYARTVAEHIRLDSKADGVLLAIYAGVDWRDASDPGYDRLMFSVAQAMAAVGMPVREAWWVGENSWRDYLCRDLRCCPLEGRSLKGVRDSMLSAELVYRGSSYEADLAAAMELPEVGPEHQSEYRKAFAQARAKATVRASGASGLADATLTGSELAGVLDRWEATLVGERTISMTTLAQLAASWCNPHARDAVMVLALTDRKRATVEGTADLLLGSPAVTPPWHRLARLEEILRHIVAAHQCGVTPAFTESPVTVPSVTGPSVIGAAVTEPSVTELDDDAAAEPADADSAAAAALTGLGWLEWCRGRGSRAGMYVESALVLVPGYRLAGLFLQLIESGLLCSWAMNQRTAWQGGGPQAA